MILNNRSIEIKRSLKKGFVPTDTTNFTVSTRFTGLGGKSDPYANITKSKVAPSGKTTK